MAATNRVAQVSEAAATEEAKADPTKFSGKKSKAAAKVVAKAKWQWDILRTSGIPENEIPKFV